MNKPHKRLLAWQKSMDLVVKVYQLSKRFPKDEVYGLTSQNSQGCCFSPFEHQRRCGRAVRHAIPELLGVAIGSLNEVSTQLEIAHRVGYLEVRDCREAESMVDECIALTYGLRKSLIEK